MLLSVAEPRLLNSRENSPHTSPREGRPGGSSDSALSASLSRRPWTHLQLLQVWPLHADHGGQQLVLQAIPGHSEVDEGGLSLQLWLVVRIGQLGVKYEPELGIVFTLFVSDFNEPGT